MHESFELFHVTGCLVFGTRCETQGVVQCYLRFKNLGFGCKSFELCADVALDVGIKAKSGLLRFL